MLNFFLKYKKIEFILVFYFGLFLLLYFGNKFNIYNLENIINIINNFGVLTFILLGVLYASTIFAPLATAIFIFYAGTIPHYQIIILAALGITIADVITFNIFKYKIHSEIVELENSKLIKLITKLKIFKDKIFMTFLGFIFMALPLTDALGIILIEEERVLKTKYFFIIDLLLNMIAIYIYLKI